MDGSNTLISTLHSHTRYIEGQSFEVKKGLTIEGTYVGYEQGGMMVEINRKV